MIHEEASCIFDVGHFWIDKQNTEKLPPNTQEMKGMLWEENKFLTME